MSPRAQAGPNLFAAAGLDKERRVLADRTAAAEARRVVGRIISEANGVLHPHAETRSLGSLVLGPPGTGKTTVARALATRPNCISSRFQRCFQVLPISESVRRCASAGESGKGTLLFVDEVHRSTAAGPFCR